MTPDDPHRFERFVKAQDADGTYLRVVDELGNGRKESHWMWFVFPQIAGLGRSAMAERFALTSLDEARAYLDHPVLGPRLLACTRLVADSGAESAEQLLGSVDSLKLRSSMTLFSRADEEETLFRQVLDRYFGGRPDDATDRLL